MKVSNRQYFTDDFASVYIRYIQLILGRFPIRSVDSLCQSLPFPLPSVGVEDLEGDVHEVVARLPPNIEGLVYFFPLDIPNVSGLHPESLAIIGDLFFPLDESGVVILDPFFPIIPKAFLDLDPKFPRSVLVLLEEEGVFYLILVAKSDSPFESLVVARLCKFEILGGELDGEVSGGIDDDVSASGTSSEVCLSEIEEDEPHIKIPLKQDAGILFEVCLHLVPRGFDYFLRGDGGNEVAIPHDVVDGTEGVSQGVHLPMIRSYSRE